MTSSPTRDVVEAVLVALDEATKEGAGPLAQQCEDVLRALLARAEAAEAERDEAERLALANEDVARAAVAGVMALIDERDAARAEAARLTAEVASLRLTLGGKTFSASVPEPVGCPMPGACATVAEIVRAREMQAAWMRVIQAENTCGVTGKPCDAVRCGCSAEQEMLIGEAAAARAALAGEAGRG